LANSPEEEIPMFLETRKSVLCLKSLLIGVAVSAPALAQQPSGLSNSAPVSGGTTEVAKGGFQAITPPPAADQSKDASTLKLTLGGFLSQGNSRSLALTGVADYFLRRSASQFSAQAAVNYGRSAPGNGLPYETTVSNYQGRVRYDYFFATGVAGFLSASARRVRFQGLDLRLNIDPGLAYYFIDVKDHRLWGELGYDLQYDVRNRDFIDAAAVAPEPALIDHTEVRHNVRAFVGYDNDLTSTLKFDTGLEYLQNIKDTENARINFDAALTTQLNDSFSVAMSFSVKFDNNPLPGVEKTDLITALNLVYTMD
jgi:putative salt-induced outer membrane protein YdiY